MSILGAIGQFLGISPTRNKEHERVKNMIKARMLEEVVYQGNRHPDPDERNPESDRTARFVAKAITTPPRFGGHA